MTEPSSTDRSSLSGEGRSAVALSSSRGKRWRRVFGAAGVLIGVVQIVASIGYGFGTIAQPRPAIFPTIVGLFLIASGLAVVFEKESEDTRSVVIPSWIEIRLPAIVMGIIVVYVALIPVLGMAVGSWLMIVAVAVTLGQRSWWKLALTATLVVVAAHLLFVSLLRVPLPEGIFRGVFW